ncbi:hypothetical protein [Tabrizicola soli]|uniref:Uncharacterized protein n=1 Tax=Tabrizicola soli TaxID=2185115 RepID=A0ABV7DVR4_9RHOB|nr:hypothetical protein [Tabrizicola soli]
MRLLQVIEPSRSDRFGNLELKFLIDESHGAGDLVMFEFTVPPRARVPARISTVMWTRWSTGSAAR